MQKIFSELSLIHEATLELNIDLTRLTTLKVKATGHLLTVMSIKALTDCLKILQSSDYPYRIIGLGANQILPPSDSMVYLKLKLPSLDNLNELKDEYHLEASLGLNKVVALGRKFNLHGVQWITGIPGTLGGAICMNAGTRMGEICQIISEVTILRKNLQLEHYQVKPESFSYRRNHFLEEGDIIISAKLRHLGVKSGVAQEIAQYLNKRKVDQPWSANTCGCVFKNQSKLSAGLAIDLLKLKGLKFRGMQVSEIHGNFIENTDGTYEDFIKLIKYLQLYLRFYSGEKFELEVKIA